MGVRGLTTYINSNSNNFFVKFELHDCVVVIDGNSLAAVLYCENLGPYSAFGGDYDILAEHVENFIKNLKNCNVVPIFVFDGGYEVKKARTVRKRNAMKVFAINKVSPDKPSRDFFPFMLRPVLQERLLELGVITLQSDYEADREIAAIAKRLNAPVLSNDSDFFIFDVPFIPLSRFSFDICRQTSSDLSNYQYMACEIFYVENFLKRFGRLEKDMLPLLATVLGNDYVNRSLFKNFYGLIKLDKSKKVTLGQRRVGGLVQWLKKETFNSALNKILTSLPKKRRQRVKNSISFIIRGYSNVETCLDKYLPDEIGGKLTREVNEIVSELSNLKISDLEDTFSNIRENELSGEEGKEDSDSVENSPMEDHEEEEVDDNDDEPSAVNKFEIPEWLLERSRKCLIAPQIITLFTLNTYFCVPQMEDCWLSHAGEIGLPILRIISGLILRTESFSYWFRQGCNSYRVKKVKTDNRFHDINIFTLNKVPLENRRNILLDILELENKSILDSYPENWQLFLICLCYWIKHRDTVKPWHIHAVIMMAIVLNIFPTKIGFFRKVKQFNRKYGTKVKSLEKIREKVNVKLIDDKRKPFDQELSNITSDDCLIAFAGILPYFSIDLTLKERPRTFERSILHYFAELQVILDLTQMLNSLLLYPFERIKISKFYNGTLLYNTTVNFKRQTNLNSYLQKLYKLAPNLFQLHMSLYNDLIQFTNITVIPQSIRNKNRRRRKKKLATGSDDSDDEILSEDTDLYIDDNNKYSLLQTANKL